MTFPGGPVTTPAYLTEELRPGDEVELRGPTGGFFTWRSIDGGPLLLVAGGSGLVPLMAMLRHRAASSSRVEARLFISARAPGDVLYRDELMRLARSDGLTVHYLFPPDPPPASSGVKLGHDPATIRAEDFGPTVGSAYRS